jgi:hypothetical protein
LPSSSSSAMRFKTFWSSTSTGPFFVTSSKSYKQTRNININVYIQEKRTKWKNSICQKI